MPCAAVVFDVGGVLAHNMWEPMLDDLAGEHGLDPVKLQEAGRLLWETFAYVPETPANTWRDMEPIVERARAFGLDAMLFRGPEPLAAELRRRDLL